MIQNKDKNLIKSLKGLFTANTDIIDILVNSQSDREKIFSIFLVTLATQKSFGLDPSTLFSKLLKYKTPDDIYKIITKEYNNHLNNSESQLKDNFKHFIENISNKMLDDMNLQLDEENRSFILQNQDKFVLVKQSDKTYNGSGIEFYTTDEGDGCFDCEIMFAKTFNTFDEADKYRNKNDLTETQIYSVEDCGNIIK